MNFTDKEQKIPSSNPNYRLEELQKKTGIESCEEIFSLKDSSDWIKPKSQTVIRLSPSDYDKWFRIHFQNSALKEKEWYLILKWTTLDFVEFCSPLHESGFETQLSGIETAYQKWPIQTYFPAFRFWSEPNSEGVYYLRVKSVSPLSIPFKILSLNAFLKETKKISAINFVFFGFGFFYILYNFFHYWESKENIYLYNNIFIIFLVLTVLSRYGILFQFFWDESPMWQKKSVNVFLGISTFGALEFARRFLNIHNFYRRMDLGYKILSSTALVFSLAPLLSIPRVYLSQFYAGFFVIFVSYIIISATRVLIQKEYKPARWLIAAIPYYLLTAVLNLVFHFDLWDYNRYWIYAFMFFMPVSFLFISMSLKERMQKIKKETEWHKSEIQILLEKLAIYTEAKPKYAKTQLNGIDVQKEIIKLIYLMENDKVFYDENLDLEILARKLELTKPLLSQEKIRKG